MNTIEPADNADFRVVVNHEEQYTLMPAGEDLPPGWRETDVRGSEAECEAYVLKMPSQAPRPQPGN